tara:strand:- start:127 stop:519 length:393 start_codon:yes stop_codon:yes gene_type:complete
MYSPCTGIFLPTFIEGKLNESISFGGINASIDSAWWVFYYLNESLKNDGGDAITQLRGEFDVLQNQFFSTAYEIAIHIYNLIHDQKAESAEKILSKYMEENFVKVINIAKSFIKTNKFTQNALNSKLSLG